MRRRLIAGNWKMNGLRADLAELDKIADGVGPSRAKGPECLICPPATILAAAKASVGDKPLALGAQDCHTAEKGAHTGDISVAMLTDAGAAYIVVGHSERRADHGETDAIVKAKSEAVLAGGAIPIICIGETLGEREAGDTLRVIATQMAGSVPDTDPAGNIVIAYEPVWAIGTGLTPTSEQIAEVHGAIRGHLRDRFGAGAEDVRILYGGSLNPKNADEILAIADVDGGLIGGASLKAESYLSIVTSARKLGE